MAAAKFDIKDVERRMRGALDNLKREFSGLRTGRATAAMLDPVVVTIYGAKMPLNQVATVSVPDARTISVSVWDRSQLSAVEKDVPDVLRHRGRAGRCLDWKARVQDTGRDRMVCQ